MEFNLKKLSKEEKELNDLLKEEININILTNNSILNIVSGFSNNNFIVQIIKINKNENNFIVSDGINSISASFDENNFDIIKNNEIKLNSIILIKLYMVGYNDNDEYNLFILEFEIINNNLNFQIGNNIIHFKDMLD
jgi:hypothetical protein